MGKAVCGRVIEFILNGTPTLGTVTYISKDTVCVHTETVGDITFDLTSDGRFIAHITASF